SFLEANASEVLNMLMTEFNLDDAKAVWQEEAMEKGIELGEAKGEAKVLELLRQGYSLDEIEAKLKLQ
ncbi:MAG: hypothetical protein LBT84_00185, partial [Spirochaetia bacterium]|nr:hypothetical protein [Spirochaetia bacterium]